MPDNLNVENQGGQGANGNTNSSASTQSGGSVEGEAAKLSQLVKGVVKDVLAEELKPIKGDISGLYSRQDKDRNAYREFMAEFKSQKANNLSDEDAMEAAESALKSRAEAVEDKQLLRKIAQRVLGEVSTQTAGNSVSGTDDVAKVIDELKLDSNKPEVLNIIANKDFTPEGRELALRRLADKKPTPPNPAENTALNGSPPPPADENAEQEKLAAEWEKIKFNPMHPKYKEVSAKLFGEGGTNKK